MIYSRASDIGFVIALARLLGAGYAVHLRSSRFPRGMGPVAPYLFSSRRRRRVM